MDFWELSKILLRRWPVFAPLAVLTVVSALVFSGQVQPTYSAQASIILLPPTAGGGTNAYLSLGIPTTAQSLAVATNDARVRRGLSESGQSSNFEVVADRRSALLTVSAEADSRAVAVSTVTEVVTLLEQRLADQQDSVGASPNLRITLQSLTPTILPVPVTDGATRLLVVILAVGLTLAAAAALTVEGLARRRAGPAPRQDIRSSVSNHGGEDDLRPEIRAVGDRPVAPEATATSYAGLRSTEGASGQPAEQPNDGAASRSSARGKRALKASSNGRGAIANGSGHLDHAIPIDVSRERVPRHYR